MKYDCYPRFLRSVIYRQCMEAIHDGQPLPIAEQTLNDPDLNIDYDLSDGDDSSLSRNSKLKKSESDAGERRRRSLLPWPRKDRSKSKVRLYSFFFISRIYFSHFIYNNLSCVCKIKWLYKQKNVLYLTSGSR